MRIVVHSISWFGDRIGMKKEKKHCKCKSNEHVIVTMVTSLYSDIFGVFFSGMYTDSKTGQLLPILVGTKMIDPAGSGQEVPILGAATDKKTGNTVPLGGTMEDPEGGGMYLFIITVYRYMFVFDGMSFVSNF